MVFFSWRTRGAALGAIAMLAVGCMSWRAPKFEIPQDFAQSPIGARLGAAATQQAAYDELFRPPLTKIHFKASLLARGSAFQGKRKLDVLFVAPDLEHLRMRGLYHGNTAFDLVVNQRLMQVWLPQSGDSFTGTIPAEGSPFMEHYGIEPTDLPLIFRIGEIVAFGDFQREETPEGILLRPTAAAEGSGLVEIDLDRASGLPRSATWQALQSKWTVQYLGWEYFSDDQAPSIRRLLPARVRVQRDQPASTLDLDVESYHLDEKMPENVFELGTMGYQTTPHPLGELGKALE